MQGGYNVVMREAVSTRRTWPKPGKKLLQAVAHDDRRLEQQDTDKILERYERRTAMPLPNHVLLMTHVRVGSLGLSRDKTTLIGRALAGMLQTIASVINRQLVPTIYQAQRLADRQDVGVQAGRYRVERPEDARGFPLEPRTLVASGS